eukprot:c7132_g2_i1.p2 GENE.c7132_g2_i1~~c7132_g2_i1.p2  ORF type:complete len:230 (+),score=84.95 c7132_g2_i1:787-1476(+)
MGVLASTFGTCLSTAQDTITSVRKQYATQPQIENNNQFGDNNNEPERHSSDLSDLFGDVAVSGGGGGGVRSASGSVSGSTNGDTFQQAPRHHSDLSDLFPTREEDNFSTGPAVLSNTKTSTTKPSLSTYGTTTATSQSTDWNWASNPNAATTAPKNPTSATTTTTASSNNADLAWAEEWDSPATTNTAAATTKTNTTPNGATNAAATATPAAAKVQDDDLDWAWGGGKW